MKITKSTFLGQTMEEYGWQANLSSGGGGGGGGGSVGSRTSLPTRGNPV